MNSPIHWLADDAKRILQTGQVTGYLDDSQRRVTRRMTRPEFEAFLAELGGPIRLTFYNDAEIGCEIHFSFSRPATSAELEAALLATNAAAKAKQARLRATFEAAYQRDPEAYQDFAASKRPA